MGDPTTYPGAALGLPAEGRDSVGGLGVRVLAFLVDLLVLVPFAVTDPDSDWVLWALGVVVVNLVLLPVRWGTTLGHAALRLRIVPVDAGRPLLDRRGLPLGDALRRALVWACCWPLYPLLAYISLDADRRSAFDRWTDTVVVEW